jgi:hypothetical protein
MHHIKKKLFLTPFFCISLSLSPYYWDPLGAIGTVDKAKEIVEVLVPVVENVTEQAVNIAKIASPTVVDASRGIGAEAASKIGVEASKVFAPIGYAAVTIYGIHSLYPIGKEIYKETFPSEEEKDAKKVNAILSRKRLNFLETEEKFRNCLLNSKPGSKLNGSGRPEPCEESARLLELFGAESEVARMTAVFKKHNKE